MEKWQQEQTDGREKKKSSPLKPGANKGFNSTSSIETDGSDLGWSINQSGDIKGRQVGRCVTLL